MAAGAGFAGPTYNVALDAGLSASATLCSPETDNVDRVLAEGASATLFVL
jgi:hypothetical protein